MSNVWTGIFEIMTLIESALIIGFSESEIQGTTIPAVAIMALIFGSKKNSASIVGVFAGVIFNVYILT